MVKDPRRRRRPIRRRAPPGSTVPYKRKRPGGLRAAPPTKRRADLGYEPSSSKSGGLRDVLQAAQALAPPPPGSKKTGPVPVKLSAVKVKQLLMTDKADMRGEELCAALDAGGPIKHKMTTVGVVGC